MARRRRTAQSVVSCGELSAVAHCRRRVHLLAPASPTHTGRPACKRPPAEPPTAHRPHTICASLRPSWGLPAPPASRSAQRKRGRWLPWPARPLPASAATGAWPPLRPPPTRRLRSSGSRWAATPQTPWCHAWWAPRARPCCSSTICWAARSRQRRRHVAGGAGTCVEAAAATKCCLYRHRPSDAFAASPCPTMAAAAGRGAGRRARGGLLCHALYRGAAEGAAAGAGAAGGSQRSGGRNLRVCPASQPARRHEAGAGLSGRMPGHFAAASGHACRPATHTGLPSNLLGCRSWHGRRTLC